MKNRRVLGATVVVAGAALAASCAPSIRSERDVNIPVPHGATWTWAGTAASSPRDTAAPPRGRYIPRRYAYSTVDPIVQQRFRRAIEGAMLAKGFRRVEDTAQADFVLSFWLDDQAAYARGPAHPGMGLAWYGGYGGWGYRPWGYDRPFGFYRPWGWGGAPWGWGFGFAAIPVYGYADPAYGYRARGYHEVTLVVQLRLRSDGEVAWIGRYRTDPGAARRMTDARMQEVVNKLFSTLQ